MTGTLPLFETAACSERQWTAMNGNDVGREIERDASVVLEESLKLHRSLGPGLLESVYETLLADALIDRGLSVQRQQALGLRYGRRTFKEAYRVDLIVSDAIILEIKSIDQVLPTHKKQLLTYLRLSKLKLGFLLNFGAPWMKQGITRIVNGLPGP